MKHGEVYENDAGERKVIVNWGEKLIAIGIDDAGNCNIADCFKGESIPETGWRLLGPEHEFIQRLMAMVGDAC